MIKLNNFTKNEKMKNKTTVIINNNNINNKISSDYDNKLK